MKMGGSTVPCFMSLYFFIFSSFLPAFFPSINHCMHLSFLPSSVFMSFYFLPVRLLWSKFHILVQTALCLCWDPPTEDLCVVRSSPTSLGLKNLHPCFTGVASHLGCLLCQMCYITESEPEPKHHVLAQTLSWRGLVLPRSADEIGAFPNKQNKLRASY